MTDADRIRKYFESARWPASPGRAHIAEERMALLQTAVSTLAKPLAALTICDVGCGGGADLARWRDAGVAEPALAGTELIPARAALAGELLPEADVRVVDGFGLPFAAESFDVCTASLVLSTVPSLALRRQLLAEMARVTARDGLVIVYDFIVSKPWNRSVSSVTTKQLSRLWRRPDAVHAAAPFLPALDVALRLPMGMGVRRLIRFLPRTHRLWIWQMQ